MYEIKDLVQTLRNPDRNKGIITKKEAQDRVDKGRGIMSLTISGDNSKGFCIAKAAMFIDDYMFGYKGLSTKWVPSSTHLPMNVVARPELPSGVISTVEDYITIFHDDETVLLETIEDLVTYLNVHEKTV